MVTEPLIVTFSDVSTAEGNRLAASLADALRDVDPNILVDRQRERPDTQDFGATLAVILGTAAVTAVAKGIAASIILLYTSFTLRVSESPLNPQASQYIRHPSATSVRLVRCSKGM